MRDDFMSLLWLTDTADVSGRPVPLIDSPALTYRFDTVEFDTAQPGPGFWLGFVIRARPAAASSGVAQERSVVNFCSCQPCPTRATSAPVLTLTDRPH